MTKLASSSEPITGLAQASHSLFVKARAPGFEDVTRPIGAWLADIGAREGLLTVFIRHTSASLTIQENADPDVQRDLVETLDRLAPQNAPYHHHVEGPDDMPAHIKAMLTSTSLSIPVRGGAPVLGTWQGIYLIEHRTRPRQREIALHFLGSLGPDI